MAVQGKKVIAKTKYKPTSIPDAPNSEQYQQAIKKLASSALPPETFKRLGLKVTTPDETAELSYGFERRPALIIPYYGLDGQPRPDKFYRVRYLGTKASFGKVLRYTQPPKTSVAAYFPPLVDWDMLAKDGRHPLVITEGELKAACSTFHNHPAIGLGGVYSWMSQKHGVDFLPELKRIDWVSRIVYLIFDSDYKTNPMVTQALSRLADALQRFGAFVYIVNLPDLPDHEKVGLDDLVLAHGVNALEEAIDASGEWGFAADLWKMNEDVIYLRDPGFVIRQSTGQKMAPAAFKEHAYANRKILVQFPDKDGKWKQKQMGLAQAWIEWPCRYELEKLTYMPGLPKHTNGNYNTWRGWGCEAVKGDVSMWHWLLDRLFGDQLEAKTWFERWCAYPIQYPGTKLFTAALLWGREHGTGKSLAFLSLKQIYGENFSLINTRHLTADYNDWAYEKQFVLADDLDAVTVQDRRQQGGVIRTMITQTEMRVSIKYVPGFSIPDCVNYGMTSNEPDPLILDERDRRQFVHEVTCPRMTEEEANDYDLWIHSEPGRTALHHHLKTLELGDFNPSAPALETTAKRDLVSVSTTDLAAWCRLLRDHPDDVLRVGSTRLTTDVLSVKQLKALADPDDKVSGLVLAKELRRAGFRQVLDGRTVNVSGAIDRYYAVRNYNKWLKADHYELVKHLSVGKSPQPEPKVAPVKAAVKKVAKSRK